MKNHIIFSIALTATLLLAITALGQEPIDQDVGGVEPLEIRVVLSRFDGDRQLASQPYSMMVTNPHPTRLRMGVRTPIPVTSIAKPESAESPTTTSFQYQDLGTHIDIARVRRVDDERYLVQMSVESSFVYTLPADRETDSSAKPLPPVVRTFSMSLAPVLSLGEALETVTSTDPISGEVIKVVMSIELAP